MMDYSAIIVAAGNGTRMKLGYNKVYHRIEGLTILERTMQIFEKDTRCKQVIVVTEGTDYKLQTNRYNGKIVVVRGGATRQESVQNGLYAVREKIVLVHDGARPYVSADCIDRLCTSMETNEAAILMVAAKDTIKTVKAGFVENTPDRETLMHAQTPQAFKTTLLLDCYKQAFKDNFVGTDDSSLVEKYSDTKIAVVEGDYRNIKITTTEDLA